MNAPDDRDNELKRLWAKAEEDEFVCQGHMRIMDLSMKCEKHSEEHQELLCLCCCECFQCESCGKYFSQEEFEFLCPDCQKEEGGQ